MRKLPLTAVLLTACAVCLVATEVAAGVSYLNEYVNHFTNSVSPVNNGKINIPYRYYSPMRKEEIYIKSAALSGEPGVVDSVLEFAIASYYSPEVVNIRPPEANEILPANNPRTAGLKLGSAVLKELAELKFLDPSNTATIGRYEGMIKYISDKNGVSRAEIEKYLKDGIAAVVREKFNEVSFGLENRRNSYDATLSYNTQTGVYTLSYGGYYTSNVVRKVSGSGVNGLLTAMKNSPDFDVRGSGFKQVQEKAGHIPAVVYGSWVDKKLTTVDAVKLAADTVADFYLNPNRENYNLQRCQAPNF
ncbi:MAG: hypothetical protein LBP37_01390 [Spirochaetaceae bacterium]|jgi:hypothetical protein|nr:hypothetical protein [Spirochaetaceae bacterium]